LPVFDQWLPGIWSPRKRKISWGLLKQIFVLWDHCVLTKAPYSASAQAWNSGTKSERAVSFPLIRNALILGWSTYVKRHFSFEHSSNLKTLKTHRIQKAWFSYVGKNPDDRGFQCFPIAAVTMSCFHKSESGTVGKHWSMKTRLKCSNILVELSYVF
jgi:hypothetical protein